MGTKRPIKIKYRVFKPNEVAGGWVKTTISQKRADAIRDRMYLSTELPEVWRGEVKNGMIEQVWFLKD